MTCKAILLGPHDQTLGLNGASPTKIEMVLHGTLSAQDQKCAITLQAMGTLANRSLEEQEDHHRPS